MCHKNDRKSEQSKTLRSRAHDNASERFGHCPWNRMSLEFAPRMFLSLWITWEFNYIASSESGGASRICISKQLPDVDAAASLLTSLWVVKIKELQQALRSWPYSPQRTELDVVCFRLEIPKAMTFFFYSIQGLTLYHQSTQRGKN